MFKHGVDDVVGGFGLVHNSRSRGSDHMPCSLEDESLVWSLVEIVF
uniref:Uncharacterized protein n=1 Tax=Anguilla anguilla TaxID=7936 RepID=A0A0E9RUX8_ANGAN